MCVRFRPYPGAPFMTANRSGENMRSNTLLAVFSVVLLFGSAASSVAQVKRVQMHIAGYLCGN